MLKRFIVVALLVVVGLWVANTSVFISKLDQHETLLIAHRGVHQIYVGSDRTSDSCQASPVAPVEHAFIENTIPSMREAFRLGADVVEIDIHLTTDDVFAVFHDWTLDCRTNGSGVTHKQAFSYLQTRDIGFNIDDGSGTYPLRGLGVGQMPSLTQVFEDNMEGMFLINFKSRRREEGIALADMLDDVEDRKQIFGVYGGTEPTFEAMSRTPDLRGFDRALIQSCLTRYVALGWSSYVPESCHNTIMLVPQNYAAFLWGWPHRFTRRLDAVGTEVVLVGPYDGSGFTSGVDDADSFHNVPEAFDGYIWTNRIELIGPLYSSTN
jgi:glycerophosphoryl diester phosphodiesterase